MQNPSKKYQRFKLDVELKDRQWPGKQIERAPIWCSVDLRDGNQALAVPMNVSQKLELFQTLVKIGFKEIEVGFPSASNTEFNFNRLLIEKNHAPDDVWLQVLVQAREDLIERTVESLVGAKKAIIHLYNSTSPAQRRVVFQKSKKEIIEVAVRGAQWIKDRLPKLKGTEVMLQYSPESFSMTEVEFAKEISEAVMGVWLPEVGQASRLPNRQDACSTKKMILNLPDTVEVAMPNVYADQIEWICRNIKNRDSLIISLHTHNDRCTGVAATELGLLAGAERVEGTLFGNGERTGNLDIVTVALNLYMHGIDPKLDFSDLNSVIEIYERCTGMTVPPRQPYAGELVFTAFSGSHQDAIKKGLAEYFDYFWNWLQKEKRVLRNLDERKKQPRKFSIEVKGDKGVVIPLATNKENEFNKIQAQAVWARYQELQANQKHQASQYTDKKWNGCLNRICSPWIAAAIRDFSEEKHSIIWDVPYLTVDPTDIGREYREVIRTNSQSGKGGVAYLLESKFGIELPKEMQREFGPIANEKVDKIGREVSAAKLRQIFLREYVRKAKWGLNKFRTKQINKQIFCNVDLSYKKRPVKISGYGNGPLDALVNALKTEKIKNLKVPNFEIANYKEHSLKSGTKASAISYTQIKTAEGKTRWGAGVDTNIELASVRAVLSALNRL